MHARDVDANVFRDADTLCWDERVKMACRSDYSQKSESSQQATLETVLPVHVGDVERWVDKGELLGGYWRLRVLFFLPR